MELTEKERRHISVFNIIVPFLVGIAIDLYVPSLPDIVRYFHTSTHLVQFTISLYMLGYGIGQLMLGILSDSLGRRKIFLWSLVFFILVSLLAAWSWNIYQLIVCRFLQGLGIAGIGVSRRALAADCFSGEELTRAMTVISTSWALGPIIGPYIGGYLQHYFNWRANFYFFAFYGAVIFLMTHRTLPETNQYRMPLHFKKIGQSMKRIILHKAFLFGVIVLSLTYSMLVMFNTVAPFLIRNQLHYSAISYGRIALFMGFGYFIGNLSNRFLIRFFKALSLAEFAFYSALLIAIVMLILAKNLVLNLYIVIIPAFLIFLCCGLVFPNLMSKCMGLFPKNAGTASALFGVAVAGGVFLMTTFATTLNTTTQAPLVIAYVVIISICLIVFCWVKKFLELSS